MMKRICSISVFIAGLAAAPVSAQARVESAPEDTFILHITQEWGRESRLGDARALQLGPDDIELRVWVGYGLAPTRGIVMRRMQNAWQGWAAVVHRCSLWVPISVGDTASQVTAAALRARARRECGQPHDSTLGAASIFSIDTLEIHAISDTAGLRRAWQATTEAGVLTLPPLARRDLVMLDGVVYVVELRHGSAYRASMIEHMDTPEFQADRQAQAIYRAVAPLIDAALAAPPSTSRPPT
jgi:hypothetical protein